MSNLISPGAAVTAETLEMAKSLFAQGPQAGPGLRKAGINIAEGLLGVNLEAPSKKLFPVYSPLRNKIARKAAPYGATATQWKTIEKINNSNLWPGASENTRNAVLTTLTGSESATFKTIGHDDYVGFEALARSKGFEDIRATAALNLLYAVMISEEKVILGGNVTALGVVGAVTSVAADTGGSLTVGTYIGRVSALVLKGYDQGADGRDGGVDSDGETVATAAAGGVIGAVSTGSITLSWAAIKGAVAYNIFVTDAEGAASTAKYLATTGATKYIIKTTATSTNTTNVADQTADALVFNGMIKQIEAAATPAGLFKDMAGEELTADGAQGIVEIDAVLKTMWDTYRLGPSELLVNSQEALDITRVIVGGGTPVSRVMLQDGQRNIVGSLYVGSYLNKFASAFAEGVPNDIPIKIHPNLPPGTILFVVHNLPYPNNQVPNVWEVETLQEYTQYEWALAQRKYEFGIYAQEVLKGYFPKAQAAIVGIRDIINNP